MKVLYVEKTNKITQASQEIKNKRMITGKRNGENRISGNRMNTDYYEKFKKLMSGNT